MLLNGNCHKMLENTMMHYIFSLSSRLKFFNCRTTEMLYTVSLKILLPV